MHNFCPCNLRLKDLSVARFANFVVLVLGMYCTIHTITYKVCWFSWPGGKATLCCHACF